jgi:DNA-binding IclR family transcriptional regulator
MAAEAGLVSLFLDKLSERGFVFVPASIRTREAALALLEKIRTDGFYVSVGESNPEVATISASRGARPKPKIARSFQGR